MTPVAIALVIVAGLIHACWNLVSKRTGAGSGFVVLYSSISCAVYAPFAFYIARTTALNVTPRGWLLVALSGMLHFGYAVTLQRGYQRADLSVVYPTARGTGPLLSTAAAVFVLGERFGWSTAAGGLLIIGGIALTGSAIPGSTPHTAARVWGGLRHGMTTGLFIAAYTLVDAVVIKHVHLPPLLLDFLSNVVRTLFLTPLLIRSRHSLSATYRAHRAACFAVAILSPLSYIAVLSALRIAPLTHIAPMREVSVLFGVLGGALLLGEPFGWKRALGALCIASGVVVLTMA